MAEPGVARCSGSATLLRLKEGPHLIANSPGTEHILEPRPTKPSPHQNNRSVLEADFVDGPGTAKLVSAGQDHVDRRFSLGFETL